MKNWNRWLWLISVLVVFISSTIIYKKDKAEQIKKVEFSISSPTEMYLINEEDLKVYLYQFIDTLEQSSKSDISLFQIERILKDNSHIKSVEAYFDRVSNIHIDVDLKQPLLRYIERGKRGYYISEEGDKIQWTTNYTPRLIIVRGNLVKELVNDSINPEFESQLKMISKCGKMISESSYLQSMVDEILFKSANDIQLVSKIGNGRVLLGDTSDLAEKLNRVEVFYQEAYPRMGWEKYSQIDVRFKEKVYCR